MKVGCWISDSFGPAQLTIIQPHRALKRFGVTTETFMTLPSDESAPGTSIGALVDQISRYDMVIAQRVTSLAIMKIFRQACNLLGKPLVYVVDDDYLHLEPHNPCYFSTSLDFKPFQQYQKALAAGAYEEAHALLNIMQQERLKGLEGLKEALTLPDHILTTTEELRQTLLPYNKEVTVLCNNMEQVFYESDHMMEEPDERGFIKTINTFGLATIPSFWQHPDSKGEMKTNRILRIGYTGTTSHKEDFTDTIEEVWNKLAKKYADKVWFVYIGDSYFPDRQIEGRKRRHFIENAPYEIYRYNLRNIDIGIAPLNPTPFNMSKSDLKALEYSSWGSASLLPWTITYNRTFKHGETALFYRNPKEFLEMAEELINNHRLRKKLGNAARKYVAENRLEDHHSEKRFKLYQSIISKVSPLKTFIPSGVKI